MRPRELFSMITQRQSEYLGYFKMLILGHVGCALAASQIGEVACKRVFGRRLNAAAS